MKAFKTISGNILRQPCYYVHFHKGVIILKYTEKAKKAIDIAKRLSKNMHYNYVGTEHILAGLLKEGTGVAAEVMSANGVELSKLLQMIEELIATGEETLVAEKDGYSPRTEHILEKSEEEAYRLGYDSVGTEHILLAMIKEGDCAASRLLTTLGINLQKLFRRALKHNIFQK